VPPAWRFLKKAPQKLYGYGRYHKNDAAMFIFCPVNHSENRAYPQKFIILWKKQFWKRFLKNVFLVKFFQA